MKLIIIRHAESERNVQLKGKTFYDEGQKKLNIPNRLIDLTESGVRQAVALSEKLIHNVRSGVLAEPDIVMSSSFTRADKTADIVSNGLEEGGVAAPKIEHNHLIRERDSGYGYEMTREESGNTFPYLRNHWSFEGKWFSTPPGGESLVQVMDRGALFLSTLSLDTRLQGKTVYAFSHGGFMQAVQAVVNKIPFEEIESRVKNPENCEFAIYSNEQGFWESVTP